MYISFLKYLPDVNVDREKEDLVQKQSLYLNPLIGVVHLTAWFKSTSSKSTVGLFPQSSSVTAFRLNSVATLRILRTSSEHDFAISECAKMVNSVVLVEICTREPRPGIYIQKKTISIHNV
jgi:hypothetical protein